MTYDTVQTIHDSLNERYGGLWRASDIFGKDPIRMSNILRMKDDTKEITETSAIALSVMVESSLEDLFEQAEDSIDEQ